MSGRDNIPDDSADRAPAFSPDSRLGVNGLAEAWVRSEERQQADVLFEALVRAVEATWRGMAYKMVGTRDGDDAMSQTWLKILLKQKDVARCGTEPGQADDQGGPDGEPGGFDPERGSFSAYFYRILRRKCLDIIRARSATAQPYDAVAAIEHMALGVYSSPAAAFEDELLKEIEDMDDRIAVAIEVLDLSERQRDKLRLYLEPEDAVPPADRKAAASARKEKERIRNRITDLADLTPEELEAVALVRKQHTVTGADAEIQRAYTSAKRKVLALFDIDAEGLT